MSSSQIYLGYWFNISGVLYLSEHAFKTILYGRNRCDSQCLITLLFKSIRLMKIKINTTTYDHSHAYNELKLRNVEETVAVPHPTGFIRDCLCGSLCVSLRLFFSVAFPRNLNSRLRSKLSSLLSPWPRSSHNFITLEEVVSDKWLQYSFIRNSNPWLCTLLILHAKCKYLCIKNFGDKKIQKTQTKLSKLAANFLSGGPH